MKSIHRETEAQVKTASPITLTLEHVLIHWRVVWNGLHYFTSLFCVSYLLCFPLSLYPRLSFFVWTIGIAIEQNMFKSWNTCTLLSFSTVWSKRQGLLSHLLKWVFYMSDSPYSEVQLGLESSSSQTPNIVSSWYWNILKFYFSYILYLHLNNSLICSTFMIQRIFVISLKCLI